MDILEELFLGGLHPSEDLTVVSDKEYKEATTRQSELEQEFVKALTPEQKKLFAEYSDEDCTINYITAKHNLILGFRLDCKMMSEALK